MNSGELMRAYRRENRLTQSQLAKELGEKTGKRYTTALISYMEKGFADLPESVGIYLASKMVEKPFRNPSDEGLEPKWTVIPSEEISALKSPILLNKDMTQTERILKFVTDFGSITTWQAFSELGITRLASRIHDLEKEGHAFDRKTETAKNRYGEGVHYTRYSLRKEEWESAHGSTPTYGVTPMT